MKHLKNLFGAALMLLVIALTLTGCGNGDNALEEIINGGGSGGSSEITPTPPPFNSKAAPLTLEAIADGTITFKNKAAGVVTYKINDDAAQEIAAGTSGAITVVAGDKVTFFGDNATYYDNVHSERSNIACTADCYIYGNIMSLISSTNFEDATELTEAMTFSGLFSSNGRIKNVDGKDLVLPATTLTNSCYRSMFGSCNGLTRAPELPAKELKSHCYSYMFQSCKNLTTVPDLPSGMSFADGSTNNCERMFEDCISLVLAPALPATVMTQQCYAYMFNGCKSLTTAPSLSATALANNCFAYMFNGCSSLVNVPALPTCATAFACCEEMFRNCTSLQTIPVLSTGNTANGSCYLSMFEGCTSLVNVPSDLLPATTLGSNCYSAMFKGCTSLVKAPDLPATTLASDACYYAMFEGCSNLNYVKCLATNVTGNSCRTNWLKDAGATGTKTFVVSSTFADGDITSSQNKLNDGGVDDGTALDISSWAKGIHGIPSGWTITK